MYVCKVEDKLYDVRIEFTDNTILSDMETGELIEYKLPIKYVGVKVADTIVNACSCGNVRLSIGNIHDILWVKCSECDTKYFQVSKWNEKNPIG